MLYYLIALFTIMPVAELIVILQVNAAISVFTGPWLSIVCTIATVLGMGVLGAFLARQQGMKVLADIQESLSRGQMPTDSLIDGAIILAGGIMLLTPGFISDVIGVCFLLPPTRAMVRAYARSWIKKQFEQGKVFVKFSGSAWFSAQGFNLGHPIKRVNPEPPPAVPPPQE